jgi:hypothetical protein
MCICLSTAFNWLSLKGDLHDNCIHRAEGFLSVKVTVCAIDRHTDSGFVTEIFRQSNGQVFRRARRRYAETPAQAFR